jgi:hypothetical protein
LADGNSRWSKLKMIRNFNRRLQAALPTPARPTAEAPDEVNGNVGEAVEQGEMSNPMRHKIFISYSHDSDEHCERVLQLANALRSRGVDAELDRFHIRPPEGWPLWCEKQLRPENSDFVLMICTETYGRRVENKVDADEGRGVFWEGRIIYDYIYDTKGNTRFIPVMLSGANPDCIPLPIRNHTHYQVGRFDLMDDGYQGLYRELTGQPAVTKPALGQVVPLGSHPTTATAAPLDPRPVETTFPAPVGIREEVSRLAYERWVARGRPLGGGLRDWLEAEAEINQAARGGPGMDSP